MRAAQGDQAMAKAITRFTVALLVLALSTRLALAEDTSCAGTITKIDGDRVTIKTTSGESQMLVEPATRIVLNGKPVESTELQVGQKVKCSCEKRDGKMICTMIELMPSGDGRYQPEA
jgi:hypothetical protein